VNDINLPIKLKIKMTNEDPHVVPMLFLCHKTPLIFNILLITPLK